MARILIVEPDRVLARGYIAALEREGHEVVWRAGAQEAISAADEQRPDLVVLELRLSTHNGAEFLYEFCSYPEWQDIPVIIASSVSPNNPGVSSLAAQIICVVDHFYKPTMKLEHLVKSVRSNLRAVQDEPVAALRLSADAV